MPYYPPGYLVLLFVVLDLLLSTGSAGAVALKWMSKEDFWFWFCFSLFINGVFIVPRLVQAAVLATYPEAREAYTEYQLAMRPKTYPELPPDEPATMLFQGADETRRIAGTPISEWVRIARVLKKYNNRLRARALGADYEQAAQLFGENPYACKKVGRTYEFTDWGKWLVDYFTNLSPSEYESIRYSVIRRLAHTPTHVGEVV